jgi:ABC-type nitrate/sulfonate/bicarbonate transport system substrate-binding protein
VGKFIIQPHGRLQEWIAHEHGYFRDEGLDYEFQAGLSAARARQVDASGKVAEMQSGAFESYRAGGGNKGVKSDISCACHWTVNQAAAQHIGRMWGKSYVVTPGGIMVPPESPITRAEQLAGQEIAVGYHSGSHFTTIQALEPFVAREDISLKFVGSVWARVDIGIARDLPATSVWGLTYLVLEQLGFRKVADTTFMIGFMFPEGVEPADVEKYMNGLRRAQIDLDLAPEKYKHLYLNEIPERYKAMVDVRRFSAGERIVFLPYTEATFAATQAWLHERALFAERPATLDYAAAVLA